jgi:hypothetical protein
MALIEKPSTSYRPTPQYQKLKLEARELRNAMTAAHAATTWNRSVR